MPMGKYFFIRSKLNGLVLDVEKESLEPNTDVITWHKKSPPECENQLWYEDPLRGVIRSKQSGLCLDVTDDSNELVTNRFDSKRTNQHWIVAGDRIQKRSDPNIVLDIRRKRILPGAGICAWKYNGQSNQHWTFEYVEPDYFFITNLLHGKVLDIKCRKREVGTKAVMADKKSPAPDSQLWYEDKHSILTSKLNGYALDTSTKNKVLLEPFEPGNTHQLWTFEDGRLVSHTDTTRVLDIKGGNAKSGASLMATTWRGATHQRWKLEPAPRLS